MEIIKTRHENFHRNFSLCAEYSIRSIAQKLTHHTLRQRLRQQPPTESYCWSLAPPDVTCRKREIMTQA